MGKVEELSDQGKNKRPHNFTHFNSGPEHSFIYSTNIYWATTMQQTQDLIPIQKYVKRLL